MTGTLWSTMGLGRLITEPSKLSRTVWDANTARALPGMGRALGIYSMLVQAELEAWKQTRSADGKRSLVPIDQPRICDRPDPDMARPTFIKACLEDYLLNGNAVQLVTNRVGGWPWSTRWYPAHRWGITPDRFDQPVYTLDGKPVERDDVVHVQRGADESFPWRGVGVVEQHVRSLNRAGLQESAEAANLTDRGMPAVAIITPNSEIDPEANDLVADEWVKRFAGADPKPGIFPKDTQITPLSWNPTDSQMTEARQMSLVDVANVMNLDAYWLGAATGSHTYKSPGPMFLALLRTSLEEVMVTFEDVWSFAWTPRGQRIRFDRTTLQRDDLASMLAAFTAGSSYFPDKNEPRAYMGFPALPEDAFPKPPAVPETAPPADPAGPPAPDDTNEEGTDE